MSTSVFVSRPDTEVFDFLADARNLALWSSGVTSVDADAVVPGHEAAYSYRYPGRHRQHLLVCDHFEPCRRIVFRGQRMWGPLGTQVPVYGFELIPHGDGTLVRLSVTSCLSAALLLLAPVVAMAWRRDLPADARKFCDLLGGPVPATLHGPPAPASGAGGGDPGAPAAAPLRTSPAPGGFDYAH
ncbi:SRPBCC family protein [Actinacidiphila paucisporea]|uniref:SRPBCC family protein n=1 Tax=Actinacidiphila paucisporea TaxID=310782 RepID=UPI001356441D|nr:SRPBCC family protein [Actinacidiphila paucisporea]